MGCAFVHRLMNKIIAKAHALNLPLFLFCVDISAAFDSAVHFKLFLTLLDQGVNPYIVALLSYWYSYCSINIELSDESSSSPIRLLKGVRQEKKGGKFFFEQAEFVKLPIGEEINVLVVHIENPAEFYVIPQDDLLGRELEENEAKINDFCINNEGTAHDPEVAEIVLAKFEGLWYRALTIAEAAPKTSSYNLQFLDYGNYAVTSSKDIRRMEDQFMYLPFVACFLTLNGKSPMIILELL
ncbi:hypothetical protein QYM36_006546 [Artemia franciscana]|uniref:Tudor domain-containing protein n=1 Tax=Artemia franciscana TaxID=6661 RepID=A0AA88I0K4_ARTSF|nr:hypothetical protein QYM36_006546 [Artemia franciscana]